MATVSSANATLRIIGDSLIPEEVTSMLGAAPTEAQRKGQELQDIYSGDSDTPDC